MRVVPQKKIAATWLSLVVLSATALADDYKPTANCIELEALAAKIENRHQAHVNNLIAAGFVLGGTAAATGKVMQNAAIKNGQKTVLLEVKAIYEHALAKELTQKHKSAQYLVEFRQSTLPTIERNISRLSTQGQRLASIGAQSVRFGVATIALTAVQTLLTSATLPLHEQLLEDPTLFLRPQEIPGGETALCKAYHYQPEKMRAAEKKLELYLSRKYDLGLAAAKASANPDQTIKELGRDESTSVQDGTRPVNPPVIDKRSKKAN